MVENQGSPEVSPYVLWYPHPEVEVTAYTQQVLVVQGFLPGQMCINPDPGKGHKKQKPLAKQGVPYLLVEAAGVEPEDHRMNKGLKG